LLIDENGNKLGEVGNFEAMRIAKEHQLDLVEISPNSHPPVCKIMDFGKFKYDLAKADKKNHQNLKNSELKEIRLSANIDQHDLSFKAKKAKDFLEKGHSVKISLRLVGRENIFADRAISVFDRFAEIAEGTYENRPQKSGNRIEANIIKKKEINVEVKDPQRNNKEN